MSSRGLVIAACLMAGSFAGGKPQSFAERVKQIHVGTSQKRVIELLGPPPTARESLDWTYRDPPNRPDGPYHWYRFTFADGKVASMQDGGVACNYML